MAAAWRVLRNNWKKTVFFTAVAAFGARYAKRKYEESEILRSYCLQALKYGNDTLKTSERPRKVIVFLNPAAKKSTARQQFEKNVLPLLNLAGLEVNVVKTEHEGQAKAFMSVLDDNIVDAVVVAGGDGTVSEIVTGLLRRSDKFVDRTPVGVIPVGTTNTLARLLFPQEEGGDDATAYVRLLCEAGMAVIRNVTKPVDVMEIKGKADKPPVYAVSHLKWGLYTDAEKETSKYWYFGPLKQWYAFVSKAWQAWPQPLLPAAHITVSPPCDGCSRCYESLKAPTGGIDISALPGASGIQLPWWRRLAGSGVRPKGTAAASGPAAAVEDWRASRSNPECGAQSSLDVSTFELCVLSSNHWQQQPTSTGSDPSDESRMLSLTFVTPTLSKADFIKHRSKNSSSSGAAGTDPSSHGAHCPVTTIDAGSVTIVPTMPQVDSWFTIDSETYEAMPTSIAMKKSALRFFCPPSAGGRQAATG